jgi:signal transduction histidine kinase
MVKNHSRIDAIAARKEQPFWKRIPLSILFELNICTDILVRADTGRTARVISNLLGNVFKSIEENWKGGTVTLDIGHTVRA